MAIIGGIPHFQTYPYVGYVKKIEATKLLQPAGGHLQNSFLGEGVLSPGQLETVDPRCGRNI
jgi:hypothetical protein